VLVPTFFAPAHARAPRALLLRPCRAPHGLLTGAIQWSVLNPCAGVEQRVEHLDVVAARGPVQRSLLVRSPEPAGVDVGAGLDQGRDGRHTAREITRPIGR
jgi:hypothetical protein